MADISFTLDPRLAADTLPVIETELCLIRLMNDARFCWLIVVPRRAGITELIDLTETDRAALRAGIDRVASALRASVPCDKLNIAAIGNMVEQLHVHVIARRRNDALWPRPVWGQGPAMAYTADESVALTARLRIALEAPSA